jgi:hypothetical protein
VHTGLIVHIGKSIIRKNQRIFVNMSKGHKVKGYKVDLATFVSSSSGDIVLPSAPDPNRE